jgi:CelD/BcsL family acetyltransferase involved in cellulose biosynthesis
MTSAELLVDAVGRIREVVHRVVDGLTAEQLLFRVDPETDSIAWLVWHLTWIQTTSETLAGRGAMARLG